MCNTSKFQVYVVGQGPLWQAEISSDIGLKALLVELQAVCWHHLLARTPRDNGNPQIIILPPHFTVSIYSTRLLFPLGSSLISVSQGNPSRFPHLPSPRPRQSPSSLITPVTCAKSSVGIFLSCSRALSLTNHWTLPLSHPSGSSNQLV